MDLKLGNKRVAIAGASRGTGLAIAKAFKAEGAEVWLSGRNEGSLREAASSLGGAKLTACDLETEAGRVAFFQDVSKTWDSLDALVLNVGGGKSDQQGLSAALPEWARMWNLNFFTHVDLVTKFSPLLSAARGAIVSLSSIAGQVRLEAPSTYSTAKAALEQYCLYAVEQLAPSGVRYNVVAPGNILAPGGRWEELLKADKPKVERYIQDNVPLQRFATPQEIANAVLFLASPAASFCTGAVLRVDGGQSAHI
jgi:3-oxoacyl-[acyl-carrier protein] reductase